MLAALLVVLLVAYFVFSIVRDFRLVSTVHEEKEPPTLVHFTPQTLTKFNGISDPKVYIGIRGRVFDVTAGKAFYGPGGPYENFAGRDALRGLALNSFEDTVLTPVDQPLDDLKGLLKEDIELLDSWELHFEGKYKVVGVLENPTGI